MKPTVWDYFVLNPNVDAAREFDADKFHERVAYTECRNVIIKYPSPLALPLKTRDSRDGLTRFAVGVYWLSDKLKRNMDYASTALSGGRLGLYLPAPRADYAVSQIGGFDGVIERARDLIESGVTDLFFDAQAKGHTYDRLVLDCMADEGLRVHVEPFVADRHTCQECSPLRPGEGLENALRVAGGKFPYPNNVTALITDRANTREESTVYAAKWVRMGCNVAVNAGGGWGKQGITAQDILDEAGVGE